MVALQVKLALSGQLNRYDEALAQTHTGAVRSAVTRIRTQGRRQIERAGLGRLKNTWRGTVENTETGANITKRGTALDPLGRVYSKASVKGRVDDLLDVFERGAVVIPKEGSFLAIPTANAPGGRRNKGPESYPEGTFRLVPVGPQGKRGRGRPKAKRYVLVNKTTNTVWFILVPQVRLKRRLRIRPLVERIAAGVPADIDRRWARAVARLERTS